MPDTEITATITPTVEWDADGVSVPLPGDVASPHGDHVADIESWLREQEYLAPRQHVVSMTVQYDAEDCATITDLELTYD